jgi:NADH:ubiquinone oxidoreductase subunit E
MSAPKVDPLDAAFEGAPLEVRRYEHGSRVPGWDRAVDLWKDPEQVPDLATTPVPDELRATIEAAMAKYPDRRSAALPALMAAQKVHGWCSPEAVVQVAAVMRLTPAYLDALATFYDMFHNEPVGRHDVYVCTNISCSLRGGDEIYDAMREAADGIADVNVMSFECLGACDIAPMASVDGTYVGPLEPQDTRTIVEDLLAGRPVLEPKQLARRKAADTLASEQPVAVGPPMEGVDAPDEGAGPDPVLPREHDDEETDPE